MARREHLPRVHSHLPERVGTGTHPVALLVRRVLRVRDVPEVIDASNEHGERLVIDRSSNESIRA